MQALTTYNKAAVEHERLHSIGEAAALLGIAVPTLRLYEREGLILPFRKPSGHRLFSDADLERIRCVREAITVQKISIAGIRHILALNPCWTFKSCPIEARNACPAYTDHSGPCWSVVKKPWECATADCRSCHVYADSPECSSIKKTITRLTNSHLSTSPSDPSE